jgi:hypothetical protein
MNILLWVLQVLLAVFVSSTGVIHFVLPPNLPAPGYLARSQSDRECRPRSAGARTTRLRRCTGADRYADPADQRDAAGGTLRSRDAALAAAAHGFWDTAAGGALLWAAGLASGLLRRVAARRRVAAGELCAGVSRPADCLRQRHRPRLCVATAEPLRRERVSAALLKWCRPREQPRS